MFKYYTSILFSILCVNVLLADIRVDEVSGDLLIRFIYEAGDDPYDYSNYTLYVTEYNGQLIIYTDTGLTVNGETFDIVPYPSDDVRIQYIQDVEVFDLDMGQADDLRLEEVGDALVEGIFCYTNSHSSIYFTGDRLEARGLTIRDDLIMNDFKSILLQYSYINDRIWMHSDYAYLQISGGVWTGMKYSYTHGATVDIRNTGVMGNFYLSLGPGRDKVYFRNTVYINGNTNIYLNENTDFVDIDFNSSGEHSMGDAFIDGGSGTDTVYQDQYWFNFDNTNSVEYFK